MPQETRQEKAQGLRQNQNTQKIKRQNCIKNSTPQLKKIPAFFVGLRERPKIAIQQKYPSLPGTEQISQ